VQKIALAAAAALVCAMPAAAQSTRVREVPRRPALWAQADTNNANTYYLHGVNRITDRPAEAAAAFYWAARLKPGWAEPLYGRRVALLMTDPDRLVRYMENNRGTLRSAEIQAIDSLQLRALSLDPFLVETFERPMMRVYMTRAVMEDMRRETGDANSALAAHLVETWLRSSDPAMRARVAYSEGRFPQALGEYERALARASARDKPYIHPMVGRIHFFTGNLAKAAEHFTAAAEGMRKEDARDLVLVYQSKALMEHSLGAVYEKMGNAAAAQEAYGRALQEDLSFAPAHRALSALAMARGDTATAVSELALAVELSPDDAAARVQYGLLLVRTRKAQEALAEFKRAAELEPYYATPHLMMARLYDSSGMPQEALDNYRAYVTRAARDDAGYANAQERIAALDAQIKAMP
jgi:tetratricopeptide (TPR) repeat protein